MINKCQNQHCKKAFDYYPQKAFLLVKGKTLNVCNECFIREIMLRSKKLYHGSNKNMANQFNQLIKIINDQQEAINNLIAFQKLKEKGRY